MKLLLQLYEAASTAPAGTALGDAAASAGGVSQDLVKAYQAVLEDSALDGSFKVGGIKKGGSLGGGKGVIDWCKGAFWLAPLRWVVCDVGMSFVD
jgi:hypothetical protein